MTHASTAGLLAAALFAIAAPAAHAADTTQETANGITVAYGDLDLGTAGGRSELKVRLESAAAQLCSPVLPGRDYRGSDWGIHELTVVYHACIGRLRERAMAKVFARRD